MRARHPRGVEEGSGGEEFGVHGLLLWVCPFAGWRIVEVTRDYKEKDRPVAFPILLLTYCISGYNGLNSSQTNIP
jgi:hypothetical protein